MRCHINQRTINHGVARGRLFRELGMWIKNLFTVFHGIGLNSGGRGRSGARGKVERAECAEAHTVLAARGKEHWAFDDEPVQGRCSGGERVGERVYATCTRSDAHYTPAGSATTATPHQTSSAMETLVTQ